jgi:hypothetical protein
MLTIQRAARLAAAPDAQQPEEQPISTTPREDRAILATSRLDMPAGSFWETNLQSGSFTLHVASGELVVVLGEGEGTAHVASHPLLGERRQTLAVGDEIVLRADDWLATESSAIVTVRNLATQPASAMLFRVIPLSPAIAPELGAESATVDDNFWYVTPSTETDDGFWAAMPRGQMDDDFWQGLPGQVAPADLSVV